METQETQEPKKKKNKRFTIILVVLVIVGGAFGITKYIHGLHHEETDDAQIESDIAPIVTRVPGFVERLLVDDNTAVKAGDTLVVIDQRDLQIRVLQAEAALENARANLATAQAGFNTSSETALGARSSQLAAESNVEIAEVRARRAEQDFKRYEELIKTNSITKQQYEQAEADRDAAVEQLEMAKRQREAAHRQTSASNSQRTASDRTIKLAETVVKEREAELEYAKLQLSYANILAPYNGVVSQKNVQPGQYVQPGQSLFALVTDKRKWIVANFKETQLEKMRPGQEVEIEVDAFPHDTFMGKVESMSPATGAKFSLLPPDNASGNFVKVVQRVPVKIILTDAPDKVSLLRAGMNVIVDVHLD